MRKALHGLQDQELDQLVYWLYLTAANGTFISLESVFFKQYLFSCSSFVLCHFLYNSKEHSCHFQPDRQSVVLIFCLTKQIWVIQKKSGRKISIWFLPEVIMSSQLRSIEKQEAFPVCLFNFYTPGPPFYSENKKSAGIRHITSYCIPIIALDIISELIISSYTYFRNLLCIQEGSTRSSTWIIIYFGVNPSHILWILSVSWNAASECNVKMFVAVFYCQRNRDLKKLNIRKWLGLLSENIKRTWC